MAEWSKAADLSSVIFEQFYPLRLRFTLNKVNAVNTFYARLAQLAARRSHNPKVVGSIPTLCNRICTIGAVGSALVLCTEGPGFEPLMVHLSRVSLVV